MGMARLAVAKESGNMVVPAMAWRPACTCGVHTGLGRTYMWSMHDVETRSKYERSLEDVMTRRQHHQQQQGSGRRQQRRRRERRCEESGTRAAAVEAPTHTGPCTWTPPNSAVGCQHGQEEQVVLVVVGDGAMLSLLARSMVRSFYLLLRVSDV